MDNNAKLRYKIAYLLEYPLDLPGGAQMSTESICLGLTDKYEPIVICPDLLKKKPTDYPFTVMTYPMGDNRIKNLLMRIKAFRKIIKSLSPDLVHIQMPESLITYGLTGLRVPFVFTDRGLFYGYRKHTMTLMKIFLKRAKLLLTTTDFNRKMWLDGTKIRPIEKVANTISDKFLEYEPNKRLAHEADGKFTIGMAGRICEEKNWPFAVKLIEMMAAEGLNFKVDLVLSVFEEGDDEKVEKIKRGIISAIGEENLSYHQDYSQPQMSDYYYNVDLFMMTSRFESFGKAAVEAMSRRCAVISTDVGGLKEVIGKADNLYTEQTPQRAVEFVKKLISDKDFLESEQEFFYNRYIENFSQDRCINDHVKIYDSILSR